MPTDAIACEPHFLDHLAPVWRALGPERGRFLVDAELMERARSKGIDAEPINANVLRSSSPPPLANPGDGPTCLAASIGDIKVARRLGYRRFAFIEHGAGQSYGTDSMRVAISSSYPGGPDREDVGLFMAPNQQAADQWRRRYPSALVEVVGCPKLDSLPAREPGPGPVVCVSFHWATPMSMGPEAGNALGDFLPALPALAQRFATIGHAHPKPPWPKDMERLYTRLGIPFVPDFEDVCRRADAYVCDNSSTIFEFAATGRPVVLMNASTYRKSMNLGLRFWDSAHVGVQVDRPTDLVSAVEEAIADSPERQSAREDALSQVYAYRHGAAERAAAAVSRWLATRQEVAA